MSSKSRSQIAAAIESLTGTPIDLDSREVKGRNVWGRVAFNRGGMLHVQITPKDKQINDAVMPSVSAADMDLGGEERYRLYRERCREKASAMNERVIAENNLILLVASNGHLTREAKTLMDALL